MHGRTRLDIIIMGGQIRIPLVFESGLRSTIGDKLFTHLPTFFQFFFSFFIRSQPSTVSPTPPRSRVLTRADSDSGCIPKLVNDADLGFAERSSGIGAYEPLQFPFL